MKRRAAATLLLGAFFAACASPEAPDSPVGSRELFVVGGSADTGHEAVVSIVTTPDAAAPELCSGVVIAARLILTAGHCTLGQTPDALTVGVGPSAMSPKRTLAVAAVRTYPLFGGLDADRRSGLDLGVVVLAEDALVTPIALATDDASMLAGKHARLVGFGQTKVGDLESRGKRFSADVTLSPLCATLIAFGDTTTNACHGDSGGPLLVTNDAGAEEVVAVVSFGRTFGCDPPSYASRAAPFAGWLARVAAGEPDEGCADACPNGATDCFPPDASLPSDAALLDAPTLLDAAHDAPPVLAALPDELVGGGCAVARGRESSAPGPWTFAALALAVTRRRRRSRSSAREQKC